MRSPRLRLPREDAVDTAPLMEKPLAQRAVITDIDQAFEGDAWAPTLGPAWVETARETHVAASGLGYAFVTLERRP